MNTTIKQGLFMLRVKARELVRKGVAPAKAPLKAREIVEGKMARLAEKAKKLRAAGSQADKGTPASVGIEGAGDSALGTVQATSARSAATSTRTMKAEAGFKGARLQVRRGR